MSFACRKNCVLICTKISHLPLKIQFHLLHFRYQKAPFIHCFFDCNRRTQGFGLSIVCLYITFCNRHSHFEQGGYFAHEKLVKMKIQKLIYFSFRWNFSLSLSRAQQRNNETINVSLTNGLCMQMHLNFFFFNQSVNQSVSHGWMMDGWFYNIFE